MNQACVRTLCCFFVAGAISDDSCADESHHEETPVKAPFEMEPIKSPVFPARDFPITAIAIKSGTNHDGWRLKTPS